MPRPSRSRRRRHRSLMSGDGPASLHPHEREILLQAVAAGGAYSIKGLPIRDMARAAQVVLDLQRARLADTDIAFVKDKQPMTIIVAITDKGRKALDGQA
jgi:hypothetical protein